MTTVMGIKMRFVQFIYVYVIIFSLIPQVWGKALHPAYELDDTVRNLIPSIVLIVGIGDEINLGTGFIVSEDGRLITNQHVIEVAENIYAVWDSTVGRSFEECELLFEDENLDIALLQLPGENYRPIPIGRVDRAEIADDIICLGFPIIDSDDFLNDTFNIAVTRGIISSIQRDKEGEIIEIWTDAAITYGNSGGPLYDLDLEGVIGINNLFADKAKGNYNLAIPYTQYESAIKAREETQQELKEIEVTGTPDQYLDEAQKIYDTGDLEGAIGVLEKGRGDSPDTDNVEMRLKLGAWYIEAERYKDAFATYEGLDDNRPDDNEFITDFGVLAYQAENYKRTVEILLPLIPIGSDTIYITLALSYFELEHFTEATTYSNLALDVTESEQVKFLARKILDEVKR